MPDAVYPRVCGATAAQAVMQVAGRGLSPRVRGHLAHLHRCLAKLRSIPACAGPPSRRCSRGEGPWVYPRVCGATHRIGVRCEHLQGLSPRVRGHQARRVDRHAPLRSIPACAGPPEGRRRGRASSTVYPRVCGATKPGGSIDTLRFGLSPRVRGHPKEDVEDERQARSIPACAGPPRKGARSGTGAEVYPRVCGATLTSMFARRRSVGLSPRVRGHPPYRRPM
jgi:hypothetical protein